MLRTYESSAWLVKSIVCIQRPLSCSGLKYECDISDMHAKVFVGTADTGAEVLDTCAPGIHVLAAPGIHLCFKYLLISSCVVGGRYDKLVGMFSGKDVPAVGVSVGIERVFSIMEAQARERAAASGKGIRATDTQVGTQAEACGKHCGLSHKLLSHRWTRHTVIA